VAVTREFPQDEDERRRALKITATIEEALRGKIRLPETVANRSNQSRSRSKPFTVDTRIVIDNTWSNAFTAIEISGKDRPGLLYEVTRALSDLNLNIGSAHIATYGERAVDVFYVTDLTGAKIVNPTREAAIRKRLEQAIVAAPEAKPAKRGAA
jgi:[protein-PII] uridylyltransferase